MNKRITTALAATMVCALTLGLAGCEGQVPQTVAPSVKDNEIIDVDVTIYCEKASHKGSRSAGRSLTC